ncbi:MAG: phosphatase PAP2 family protein [Gammaproteobacteria bacterium]|nr:phosphatase PAP2 family protein [Gammaproteobacteria bacterium]
MKITPAHGGPPHWTTWGVPVTAAGLALLVLISGIHQPLFLAINQASRYTGDALWANLTILGDGLVVFALVLPFVGRRPDAVWALLLTGLLAALATHGLKTLIGGGRPAALLPLESFHVIGPMLQSGSFPSGHTIAAFSFAGAVSLLFHRPWLTAALVTLATLAGLSRIVVGAHWPLDVLGGAAIGWLCAAGGVAWARRWPWGLRVGAQRSFAIVLTITALAVAGGFDTGYAQAAWMQSIIGATILAVSLPAVIRLFKPAPKT